MQLPSVTLILIQLLFAQICFAQNLVVNGDFEEYKKLPQGPTVKKLKIKHIRAINGSPDYFHAASKGKASPTYNSFGNQKPQSGRAFAGITLTSAEKGECNAREYMEFKLSEPLTAGFKYELQFYVSCADFCGYYTDQIGAVFTQESLKKTGVSKFIGHPDVTNPLHNYMNDTANWMEVKLIFNAKGGEKYMTLGNFHKCNFTTRITITPNDSVGTEENLKTTYRRELSRQFEELSEADAHVMRIIHKMSYYFIDNVSLTASRLNEQIVPFIPQNCTKPAAISANLLPDPNFDTSKNRKNKHWKSPSKGTPDFINGVAGIYLFSDNHLNNREYITAQLDTTITNCDSLYFEMQISQTGNRNYLVDKIGAAFADSIIYQDNRSVLNLPTLYESPSLQILETQGQWITLCGTFRPKECNQHIIIGNFNTDDSTFIIPTNSNADGAPYAHYQIDNVKLFKISSDSNCVVKCAPPKTNIPNTVPEIPKPQLTPDTLFVQFKTNETHVDFLPKDQLIAILEAMNNNPKSYIRVVGHTDDIGVFEYNLRLSKLRAQKVAQQLINFGIPKEKVFVEYHGESMPLVPNTSKINRQKNRRVEIIVH